MSNKEKSVVNFHIDGTLSAEQASKSYEDDYELDFHSFLEGTVVERSAEDFSYSNKSVQKAGKRLRKKEGDLKSATAVIQQFRAAHEKPLNTIAYFMGRTCRELGIDAKPVTRLKRLETIINKLQRKSLDGKTPNATCVTNMSDIGGCRVIFSELSDLEQVKDHLLNTVENGIRIKIRDLKNYITAPKPNDCGYRSLHIIFRYEHASGKNFNIEVQLRTRLQHLWATTVEIVDILEGTNIKTHSHAPRDEKTSLQLNWEEILSIMSRFIADAEGAIPLPDREKATQSIRLAELDKEIKAVRRLKSFNLLSEKVIGCCEGTTEHVLMIINEAEQKLIFREEFDDYRQAIALYSATERLTRSNPRLNTLLVSTKDMGQLSDAYPNYLGDCASFVLLLEEALNYSKH